MHKALLRSIDDTQPDDRDLIDIRNGQCLNCYEPYYDLFETLFVRLLDSGKLIWWHAEHCTFQAKKPPHA